MKNKKMAAVAAVAVIFCALGVVFGSKTNAPAPVAVAPSRIKAGRGATTTLVSQRPTPPLHQQTGLTKIAGNQGFVDPVTLLPRKGAQGAAMTAVPASQAR